MSRRNCWPFFQAPISLTNNQGYRAYFVLLFNLQLGRWKEMIPYLSKGVFVRKGILRTWLELKLSLPIYLFEPQTVTQPTNRASIDLINAWFTCSSDVYCNTCIKLKSSRYLMTLSAWVRLVLHKTLSSGQMLPKKPLHATRDEGRFEITLAYIKSWKIWNITIE